MTSKIHLEEMRFYAYHGVLEQERKVGNYFVVDLLMTIDFLKATESDLLEDTINYAEIYSLVEEEMKISSYLLEHLAGRIYNRIYSEYPQTQHLRLRVSKEHPPFKSQLKSVTIILEGDAKK